MSGTIETVVFAGASRTALVRLHALPDSVLRAAVPSNLRSPPERGSQVSLAFDPEALRVFGSEKRAEQ